jgi:16S rRNA (cytosine967-C5)-methyltransferase
MTPPPPAPRAPDPRALAAEVVRRSGQGDAFAAAVLDAEFARHPQLDPRDRRFATELAYGTLRTWGFLRAALEGMADRGRAKLDPLTEAHLLVAAYQLLFLPRVPAHAAVHRAVEAVKRARGPGLASFANALLRRLTASGSRPELAAAVRASAPPWLLDALDRSLGPGEGGAFLEAGPVPPPLGLRVRRGERDAWVEALRAQAPGATIEPGAVAPTAIIARGAGDPRRLPGVASRELVVQEEGSQAVALALGARPGERVLDACCGRGNKTLALADAVGPEGAVDAADLFPKKLERLRAEAEAAGVRLGDLYAVDWSVGPGAVPAGRYDRVLVDAPCSGVGTLRRRPEIARRRTAEDVARLAELQAAIVRRAAPAVRPGGTLVYAVCSVLADEFEGVVGRGLDGFGPPSLRRLLPQREGTDGYAIATFVRDA